MNVQLMRQMRLVAFLALVTMSLAYVAEHRVAAAAAGAIAGPRVGVAAQDFCDDPEVCAPWEECDRPCYVDLFENTCGGYGGTPNYPEGNCLGECDDGFCNPYNDEDMYNCYEDCGECGDDVCTPPENSSNCYADCGVCGDSNCEYPENTAWAHCCLDCGSCNGEGEECNDHEDCTDELSCNYAGFCCTNVLVSGCGFCDTWEDCIELQNPPQYWTHLCVTKGTECNGT